MSVYAFPRLPGEVALWKSLWSADVVREEKSFAFFIYPVAQTLVFLVFTVLARFAFFRAPSPESEDRRSTNEESEPLLDLRREVVYLGLIFLNLVFIHLQTSLILVSHGLAGGINRFYFAMLLLVLLGLVPYYRLRRRMLRAGARPV